MFNKCFLHLSLQSFVQEGENICFEVLEAVSGSIRRQDKTTVFRAKFSSITDKDIVAAMNSLGQPDENQSKSVDARQELDLRIGCAFTRFQTRFFQVWPADVFSPPLCKVQAAAGQLILFRNLRG